MSSIFDDRERAFESKWARDADQRLRVLARRNRRLAEWAVAEAGLPETDRDSRVRTLVKTEFEPAGEDAFLRAVADLLNGDTAKVSARAAEFEAEAERELGTVREAD